MRQIDLRESGGAEPSVGDGVCRRSARLGNCEDVAPNHYWTTIKPDGTYRRLEPIVASGTPPIDHAMLTAYEGGY